MAEPKFTNEWLVVNFPEQLATRKPFIFSLKKLNFTKPTFQGLIAQNITDPLAVMYNDAKPRIVRCTQLFLESRLQEYGLKEGSVLEDTCIKRVTQHNPVYAGQQPKKFTSGEFQGQIMLYQGFPMYDNNVLVPGNSADHIEWQPDQLANRVEAEKDEFKGEDVTQYKAENYDDDRF